MIFTVLRLLMWTVSTHFQHIPTTLDMVPVLSVITVQVSTISGFPVDKCDTDANHVADYDFSTPFQYGLLCTADIIPQYTSTHICTMWQPSWNMSSTRNIQAPFYMHQNFFRHFSVPSLGVGWRPECGSSSWYLYIMSKCWLRINACF